jgi:hypothetical protein
MSNLKSSFVDARGLFARGSRVTPRQKPALPTWDGNEESTNVIPFPQVISSNVGPGRSAAAARTARNATESLASEGDDNYRHQMFVNGLGAAVAGTLVLAGQWIFTVLLSLH